ncbi:hypothetical protein GCK32_001479, partial [Trichostrongylus colubriformis]
FKISAMVRVYILLCTVVLAYGQEFSSVDCNFQYSLCGWEAEAPWRLTESVFLPSELNLNPIMLVGGSLDDSFMTAQGYFGSNTTADLISPLVESSPVLSILSFKYTKVVGGATLQASELKLRLQIILNESFHIIIKEGSNYRILDTITTNSLVMWIRRTLVIPATVEPYQIFFRVSKLRDGFDTISVDDVLLRTTAKNVMSAEPMDSWNSVSMTEIRELRRSPTPVVPPNMIGERRNTMPRCKVKCSFKENACSWSFSKWKLLNGKIITEAEPEAWLESEPVLLPMNAHFELDMSIRFSPLPSKFLIKTSTRQGQFIAVTNTNIVDESGLDLACGGDLEVIRPRSDNLIRLTAIQKLDTADSQSSKLLVVSTPKTPPIPSHPSAARAPSTSYTGAFAFATDPKAISPSAFATLPIPAKVSSSNLRRPPSVSYNRSIARSSDKPPKSVKEVHISLASKSPTPIVAFTRKPSLIQELMARQPLLADLIRHLSKKYGFENMPDEQVLQRLPQIQRFLSVYNVERHPDKHIQPLNFVVSFTI